MEFLNDSPDLGNFEYKPWNDEQRNKVMGVLSQFSSPGASIETVTKAQPKAEPKKTEAAATKVVEKDASAESKGEDKGDDFNDFINGLDL